MRILCLTVAFLALGSTLLAFPLRILKPGSPVPDLMLPALSGGAANVLGDDGQITVILFWGTDTKSKQTRALDILQTLQAIEDNFGDQGVTVRSVNVDKDNREALKRLVKEERITVPVLLDEEERLYGAYGLFVFPTVAIVDRDRTLKTAVGYTHNISGIVSGTVQVMLGLKTAEELQKELNPEEVVEPPDNVKKAARRLNLGRKLMERRLTDMAGRQFEKAVELDAQNAGARAELGAFYVLKGEFDKARDELAKAVELDPNSIKAHLALGALYRRKSESDKAVAELESVLDMDPIHAAAFRELGAVYEDMGCIEEALKNYRKALDIIFGDKRISE